MPSFTLAAYQFMREHCGFSHSPALETPEQGRVKAALDLARAEQRMRHEGYGVRWERDFLTAPDDWTDIPETLADLREGRSVLMVATLFGPNGEVVDMLGGIHLSEPWFDDPYRRLMEAQLGADSDVL